MVLIKFCILHNILSCTSIAWIALVRKLIKKQHIHVLVLRNVQQHKDYLASIQCNN
jgi:hypothetical protein